MEYVSAMLIHMVVPLLGLKVYLFLCQRMKDHDLESPPLIPLFFCFLTYGGWLVVLLTAVFWRWSGMATLGIACLLFLAPLLMLSLAFRLFRQRKLSLYHRSAFVASAGYIVMPGLIYFGKMYLQ
jgi:hypothetical protein